MKGLIWNHIAIQVADSEEDMWSVLSDESLLAVGYTQMELKQTRSEMLRVKLVSFARDDNWDLKDCISAFFKMPPKTAMDEFGDCVDALRVVADPEGAELRALEASIAYMKASKENTIAHVLMQWPNGIAMIEEASTILEDKKNAVHNATMVASLCKDICKAIEDDKLPFMEVQIKS